MTWKQLYQKNKIWNSLIILFSVIGLLVCITLLFPQVRAMILDTFEQKRQREIFIYQSLFSLLLSFAMGGICIILFFNYLKFTNSGRSLVKKVRLEIKDCISDIDYRSFIKPVLLMFIIYLLGVLTIIRANFTYLDDMARVLVGNREWSYMSRYLADFLSIFIHGDTVLKDIAPLPLLISIFILAVSNVLLVYIICNKKIPIIGLLASIPLGLSPYFLECLSFKFDTPHMALSILAGIVPFLFIVRQKAFLFVSVLSLLVMCMTYQASSGVYMMIAIMLCFQYWNKKEKTNKEILSFFGVSIFAFCITMLIFRLFLMMPLTEQHFLYVSNSMHPLPQIISGTMGNIKNYAITINNDFGIIWKIGILLIFLFFIIQSTFRSTQKKILSFFISIIFIGLSFFLSFGGYSLLTMPIFYPRALFGFGVFLAILCINVVSGYKTISKVIVLALNWCFIVFAFSYGNALADQARYADFRIGILLHDLSTLYPDRNMEDMSFTIENTIEYTPSINNISKHYPVIERLVPRRLGFNAHDFIYCFQHFNYAYYKNLSDKEDISDLPVVLDSYYHTIKSDEEHVLIILKH